MLASRFSQSVGAYVRKSDELKEHDLSAALKQLEHALEIDSRYPPAVIRKARLLDEMGSLQEAWAYIWSAYCSDMRDSSVISNVFRLAVRAHHFEEGNQALSEASSTIPLELKLLKTAVTLLEHQCRFADALKLIKTARDAKIIADQAEVSAMLLSLLHVMGSVEEARNYFENFAPALASDSRVCLEWAEISMALRDRNTAKDFADKALINLHASDIPKGQVDRLRIKIERMFHSIDVLEKAEDIMRRSPVPKNPNGLIVIVTFGSPYTTFVTALPALELQKAGYAVTYLTAEGCVATELTGNELIDSLSGIVNVGACNLVTQPASHKLAHNWIIDWQNRIVSVGGINFYQTIFENLCNRFRRFSIDAESPIYRPSLDYFIRKADTMLSACEKIYDELASENFPIRFLSGAPHLVPTSIPKIFCDAIGHRKNMNFVGFLPSYEHYFSNLKNELITKVSVSNMTVHRFEQRMPIFARKAEFESWLQRNLSRKKEIEEKISKVIRYDRVGRDFESPEAAEVMQYVLSEKKRGRTIVGVIGKILYDICEPEQGGPAHADITHWLNDTIRAARHSDALFLIKPHPSEIKKTFGRPTELFTDLIEEDLPENVIILKHRWFNMSDLMPVLDVGLTWAGTTSLELGVARVPSIVSSTWGIKDHPIDFYSPKSSEHYHQMLRDLKSLTWSEEQSLRCMMLIEYFSTDEIMIPYEYAQVPLRGVGTDPKIWVMEKLEEFYKNGDPAIDEIVRRVLVSLDD